MSDGLTAATRRPRPGGSVLLVGNVAILATGLVTAPFTARALGPDGRGILVVVTLVASLIVLFGSAGYGWMARDEVSLRPERSRYWLSASWRLTWVIAPVAGVIGVVGAWLVSMSATIAVATVVFFVIAGFASTRAVASNILLALGRPERVGFAHSAYAITTIIVVVGLFAVGHLSVATAIWANSAGLIVQAVVLVGAAKAAVGRVPDGGPLDAMDPHGRRRALYYWRAQLSEALAIRSDSLIVAMSATTTVVGLYSVAALLAQVGNALFATVIQMSFARLPKLKPDSRLAVLFTLSVTGAVVYLVTAWPALYFVIPWVFGGDFIGARAYLPSAALVTAGTAVFLVVAQDAARRAAGGWVAAIALVSAVVGLIVTQVSGVAWGIASLGLMLFGSSGFYVFLRIRGRALMNPVAAARMLASSTPGDGDSTRGAKLAPGEDD